MEENERINLLPEKSMKKVSEFILSISKSQNQPTKWGEWKGEDYQEKNNKRIIFFYVKIGRMT